jgi:hypothetical protein
MAHRGSIHVPLDREKPVALARQIQAHLERLIARGTSVTA